MENSKLIGLFLIIIGLGMLLLKIIYSRTGNLQKGWVGFGVVYTVGIFGFLTNQTVLDYFGIIKGKSFISPIAFVILGLGIMLSYIFFKNTERRLIISILIVVGIHFIPFGVVAYPLTALVVSNALIGLRFSIISNGNLLLIDSLIKIIFGLVLFA